MTVLPTPAWSRLRVPALATLLMVVLASLLPPPAHAVEPEGVWPLAPEPSVLSPFSPPTDPWGSGHRGVDLAGTPAQVVHSALAGKVGFAGSIAGKPVVTVLHGGRRTTYEPVVATVAVGEVVAAGDPIGRLAVVASHCFPAACLHWGLRRGDDYLDPLTLVGGGEVRLLPLWRDTPAPPQGDVAAWAPLLSVWSPALSLLLRPADGPGDMPDAGGRW